MLLYLINPSNMMASMINTNNNKFKNYMIWKPLGLLVVASLTPPDWEIKVIDENVSIPDYNRMPRPDLVGITAFSSQAPRAYDLASEFRQKNITVVMGGIHTSMCDREALQWADTIVIGEAESIWAKVISDFEGNTLKRVYRGKRLPMENMPEPRHDLLTGGYKFGSIQTTRGCPLSCIFCSVSAFNGKGYRTRPIADVIHELQNIKEKYVLIVDDNLIGINRSQIERAKELFRQIIKAGIRKIFIAQATINIGDDDEFLRLAARAGLKGVFIGFESITEGGLLELQKKYNAARKNDFRASVKKIKKHGLIVLGSFIMGLDDDAKNIGKNIAAASIHYGIDILNLVLLTPLPGTRLWKKYMIEKRIIANNFPEDWKYYTLTYPVTDYKNLSWADMFDEISVCLGSFYSYRRILGRFLRELVLNRKLVTALFSIIANISNKRNIARERSLYKKILLSRKVLS